MPAARRLIVGAVPPALGLLAGVLSSWAFRSRTEPEPDRARPASRVVHLITREERAIAPTVANLQRRIAAIEASRAVDGGPQHASTSVRLSPVDPEEARRYHEHEYQEFVTRHHAERVDQTWAPQAAARLREGILRLTAGESTLEGIECRTETCLAMLSWPDHQSALQHYRGLLHGPYQENCSTAILFREDPGSRPYRAQLRFNCERGAALR